MESNKVKLPKEVVEALELVRRSPDNPTLYAQLNDYSIHWASDFNIHMDVIMTALVNGYEVEQTPEDKVMEFYTLTRDNLVNPNSYYSNEVKCETVIHVLDLLNIKIKGVND